jgi:Flp pilus assembly protein TadG
MCSIIHGNPRVGRRGATVVEVTVIVAVTFMILFGIFEYGRFLMTRQIMENAAREGARYAVVHTYDKSTVQVQDVVFTAMSGQESQLQGFSKTSNISVYRADGTGNPDATDSDWKNAAFAEPIGVRITGNYSPILPSFLLIVVDSNGTIPLQVTAIMYSEAN